MAIIGVKGYRLALDLGASNEQTNNEQPNKRARAWFLSLLMFANSFGLAGCSLGDSNPDVDTPPTFSKDDPYYGELMQSYWQERVLAFFKKLDKVTIKYDHENDYPDAKDIKSQMESAKTTAECDYKYGGDFNEIWNLLLRNSVDYTNSNPDFILPFMTEEDKLDLSNEDKMAFETTIEKILLDLIQKSTNNVSEDICTLKDYTIVYSYGEPRSPGILAITNLKDNIMIIYPNIIREYAKKIGISFKQALSEILEHEINHIRAEKCKCREELGQEYNSVGNSSLMEAAAESHLKYTGNTVLCADEQEYFYERKSEALLLMLGLFKDGFTADDYYNAVHDCNAQDYCRFFGIDVYSEEELKTFSNILYSIDAINLRNNLLANHFEEGTKLTDEEIIKFVGQEYKADIFKMVLANMMNYTVANSDFSLTDNIVLVNVIKSIIVQEVISDPEKTYQIIFDADFAQKVIELYEIYIDFLSEYYGVSKEEIRRLEEDESVKKIIRALSTLCSEQDYPDSEEKQYANNLIERFPILKQILIMYPLTLEEWSEFLSIHNEKCSENKESYRLAIPSFINASSSNFKFAPSREERRHPGTTIDTEVVNTALVQACFSSKQHEIILNKTAVNKGQGKGIKYTKANPKLARFTKTSKTYKKIPYHI